MVTTPILVRQQVIGVAEISRKGANAGAAGADFTDADLKRAREIFERLAPYFAEARPDDF
jgi:hypothetical protein